MTHLIEPVRRTLRPLWHSPPARLVRSRMLRERRNSELKDSHAGTRAFIVGNGPSILRQDLARLRGELTFVLNSFFYHPDFHAISPTYLCACDPFYLEMEHRQAWYGLHKRIGTTGTTMLFPKAARKLDRRCGLFGEHQVYYLLTGTGALPPLSSLTYCPTDLTKPLACHGLVFMDMAMLAAFYMGASRIYLTGMDAGPISSFEEYVNYDFYGKDPLIPDEQYRRDYESFCVQAEYGESRSGLYERSAECVKRTFAKGGVEILNATWGGGNLEGFDHVDFENVIEAPGP